MCEPQETRDGSAIPETLLLYDLVLIEGVSTFKPVAWLNQFCKTIGSVFDSMGGSGCCGARVEKSQGDELVVRLSQARRTSPRSSSREV
jgi:hypothetical protein